MNQQIVKNIRETLRYQEYCVLISNKVFEFCNASEDIIKQIENGQFQYLLNNGRFESCLSNFFEKYHIIQLAYIKEGKAFNLAQFEILLIKKRFQLVVFSQQYDKNKSEAQFSLTSSRIYELQIR